MHKVEKLPLRKKVTSFLATQIGQGNTKKSNMQAEMKEEIHQVRIGWWMRYTQNMWIDHLLCVPIFRSYDGSIEGGAFCALRSRLLVAAGGSLRFGCRSPAPRRIRGHPFRIAAVNTKKNVRSTCTCTCKKNAIRNLRWTRHRI